jgi:hypothetical protein
MIPRQGSITPALRARPPTPLPLDSLFRFRPLNPTTARGSFLVPRHPRLPPIQPPHSRT